MKPDRERPARENSGPWDSAIGHGMRELAIAVAWASVVIAPTLGFTGWSIREMHRERARVRQAEIESARAYERLIGGSAGPTLTVSHAAHGRDVFNSVCAACHGASGTGVEGMGRNLVESDFVARSTDADLHQFVITGRPDARPTPMPPRAGRDDLTDQDISDVVVYLRGLQDPRRMPELPAPVVDSTPSDAQKAAALAAAGGDEELAAWIASGDKLFHSVCIACHGKGGVGITGNGKPLVRNDFINMMSDDDLLAFLKVGRSPSDPKNTTGIQMPPKGGNPALSEDDMLDIISYLRTLQKSQPSAPKS
jgi:disulfide bond formation protein DsbB